MEQRIARISIVVLLIAALILPPPIAEACGPDFSGPTFIDDNSPDAPLEVYARGKLGLIQPGYRHVFLYAAYRNLVDRPFSENEIAAMKNIWNRDSADETSVSSPSINWIDAWKAARNRVSGYSTKSNFGFYSEKGIFRAVQKVGQYFEYYNCLPGAFQKAVQVLDQRVAQFGAQNPYIEEWVAAQDQVFENCSGGTGYPPKQAAAAIPVAASESAPEAIRQDRAYQIAAAQFYAGKFEEAKAGFAAIVKDPASQYRTIAPYLVARALVREGTLGTGSEEPSDKALAQAEQQLHTILADMELREVHHVARGLLGFVLVRLHPEERAKELEAVLLSGKAGPDFHQDLTDYLWLLDHPIQNHVNHVSPASIAPGRPRAVKSRGRLADGDMADWILTLQQTSREAFQHSLPRWEETRSLPWFVAAISQAGGNDAAAESLEAAALKVAPDSPAHITVIFHRLRLLAEAGRAEEARKGLDSVLSNKTLDLTLSVRNEFLALRMKLSTGLNDLLVYAPRVPSNTGSYLYSSTNQTASRQSLFDSDASVVLTEKLPLQLLAEAARSNSLPVHLRKEVAIAAWTRAILLNDETVARELSPILAGAAPELSTALDEYSSAKTSGEKGFAAAFLLLHFPGMRPFVSTGIPRSSFNGPEPRGKIDSYHDNWWCLIGPQAKEPAWHSWNFYSMYVKLSGPLREIYPDGKIPLPDFLTESEHAALGKEWATLQSLPSAPSWLARQTFDWAKAHPEDPRIPEALHLVVRATRYGCLDAESGRYSKQAFTVLHSRYPHSEWAKKTPYWFN